MRIEVAGIPAPQGSKRHVGGGRMVEQSRAVGPWREAVRAETQRAWKDASCGPFRFPARVAIGFRVKRPASHYGTGRNARVLKASAPVFPQVKKWDIDKLARAVLDGLVAGGALADDSQVVDLLVSKRFATTRPGCIIEITERT